jgi:hypothetical protein
MSRAMRPTRAVGRPPLPSVRDIDRRPRDAPRARGADARAPGHAGAPPCPKARRAHAAPRVREAGGAARRPPPGCALTLRGTSLPERARGRTRRTGAPPHGPPHLPRDSVRPVVRRRQGRGPASRGGPPHRAPRRRPPRHRAVVARPRDRADERRHPGAPQQPVEEGARPDNLAVLFPHRRLRSIHRREEARGRNSPPHSGGGRTARSGRQRRRRRGAAISSTTRSSTASMRTTSSQDGWMCKSTSTTRS